MDQLVSLCKRRGFIFQNADIYGGMQGVYDYGPLGVELKNNLKAAWWRAMVYERDDIEGLDAAILTNRKVRSDIAMTGEITLRGRVLPIGGLKEKLLAALSHGIKEVLIPKGNEKDIAELPDIVKEGLIITPVKTMDEVLAKALV